MKRASYIETEQIGEACTFFFGRMKKFPIEERENGLLFDDVFHAKFPSPLFIDQLSIQDFER